MAYIKKLSLYVITKNEEKRLPKVLESAKSIVDEIIIVDSGSTDGTQQVALSFGAKFLNHEWESVGHQVSWAEQQCTYDWVLRLDADEVLSPGLVDEIKKAKESGDKDGYFFKIGEMYPGLKKPNPWVKHYNLIRMYDRTAYRMSGRIGHDDVIKLKGNATCGQFKSFVHHYSYISLHRLVEKRNVETDLQVVRALHEGKKYSPWRMLGAMTMNFFKFFFLDRFFFYGWWGFIHSINIGYMRFMKFSKYYEHEQLEKFDYPD